MGIIAVWVYWLTYDPGRLPTDFRVYRAGGSAILDGEPLNQVVLSIGRFELPFTYPPFAALVFAPLALISGKVGATILLIGSLLCLGGVAYLCAKEWPWTAGVTSIFRPWQLALIIYVIAAVSEVTTENFYLGQINLYLILIVLFDNLHRSKYTGFLTGIAAGFKVTPAIFILFMLLTRRWADAARAIAGFLVTILVSLIAGPGQVWTYWTHDLFATDRVGDIRRLANASYRGITERLLDSYGSTLPVIAWLLLAVITLAVLMWVAMQWWPTDRLVAVSLIGICGLLINPISWNHHFIWLIPATVAVSAMAVRAFRNKRTWIGIIQLAAIVIVLVPNLLHVWRGMFDIQNLRGYQMLIIGLAYGGAACAVALALICALPLRKTYAASAEDESADAAASNTPAAISPVQPSTGQ